MRKTRKDPKGQLKQPLKCWLVEISLTSGEELQFYVNAIDQETAFNKAERYAKSAENSSLANYYHRKGFTLFQ